MPEELANQIAAGEVVERPASVVKELVENSLDAGAARIDVDIEGGGLSLVRVTDDGGGMGPQDAELCLLRHATSKLRSADDLFHLETMGFRGEALASIASVSRLSLTTRSEEALAGYRILIEGGQKTSPSREVGAPIGTQFEVRDLFYNVPARLKFMKSESTETSHIAETLLRLSLAFPGVHFRLRQKGKVTLDLPPHKSGLERSRAALSARGKVTGPPLLYEGHAAVTGIEVEAHVGAPSDSTAVPRNVFLLVNRRFVRDRSLLHAALAGYGELLEKGRYPLLVLHLRLDPTSVDVNVHPQKLEVRLQQADAVYSVVRESVRSVCAQAPWLRGVRSEDVASSAPASAAQGGRVYTLGAALPVAAEARPAYGAAAAGAAGPAMHSAAIRLERPASEPRSGSTSDAGARPRSVEHQLPLTAFAPSSGLAEHRARLRQAVQLYAPSATASGEDSAANPAPDPQAALSQADPAQTAVEPPSAPPPEATSASPTVEGATPLPFLRLAETLYLGQLYRTYLLCEQGDELLLIDQHAAHERVVFERLRSAHQQAPLLAQRLLFPTSLEFDPRRAALVGEFSDELVRLGFELQPFGGRSFALQAAPDLGSYGRGASGLRDPETLLRQVLDELEEHGRSETVAARTELLLATMACHSAVRAGDVLDEAKVRALLSAMDEVHYSPYCPHGRPVLVRMSRAELERRFGRA
jgi:DNA mismatch repair protein MutL